MKTPLTSILLPFLFLFFFRSSTPGGAGAPEDTDDFCAQAELHRRKMQEDETYRRVSLRMEEQLYTLAQQPDTKRGPLTQYTLPVVVHIIHDGGGENISDALVADAIQHLNDAFANVGYYNPATGVDTEIAFCLARRDPQGGATTGVNRVQSALTGLNNSTGDQAMKNLSRWDPTQYINVWVVREICSNNGCGVAGYAYLPGAHGQPYDGIVLEAGYMGGSPAFSTVLVHEMGHYLGLYHTFEGGCPNSDCRQQGDRICDTPPDNTTARTPCPTDMNSCSTDEDDTSPNNPFRPVAQGGLGDQPDTKENYMDYSRLECYGRFSQGQKERMLSVVENIRSSLLDSPACIDPCPTPITAAFSAGALSVPLGSTVNFTNTSANADSYEWAVDGTAFSTAVDASYTFNAEGNFQVTLTAFSNLSNCLPTDSTLTIEVFCPVEAGFTASDVFVLAGASVTFTNTSTNATSYTWLVNGTVVSASPDYVLNTTEPGLYNVCLRATGPLCESLECSFVEASCSVPCEEICDNGMDDDNDGLIDCDDDDCPCFEDCGNTFVKTIGLPNTVDGATAIVAAGDGTFYIGGYLDEEAMIAKVTAEGEMLWVRRFDFTDRPDHIINLYRDSDGFLVGASFGDDGTGAFGRGATAFRYDPENGQLLWVNYFNSRGTPDQILTNPANGNFYFSGGDILTTGAGNADNASLAELDRNTGAVLWRKEFNRGSSDRFFSILPVGNALYCLGRYTFDAYFEKMRVTLAAFTGNGNLEWSKYYLLSSTQNARMYGTSLKLDAGELVASFYGDPNGSDLNGSSTTGIMKTDLAGGLQWAKTYRLTGYPSLQAAFHLVVVPDGYLLYGYAISGDRDLVAIKTDKQGNALWAKAYGGLADDDLYYPFCKPPILQSGGNIYFVGRTRSGGSEDALLVKALADGSLDSDDCDFVREVAVTTNDWTNLFEADAGLQEQPNPNINPQLRMVQAVAASAESNILCQASPVDATVALDSAYCNGDSLAVALRICNEGTDTLFNALPYTFYDGNPTAGPGATVLAGGFTAPAPILPGECYSTTVSVPYPQGQQIYCIANDNGALMPVFSLETGFPPTEIIECDYTNNIDSARYETTVPDIDLGPDTSVCENGVFLLDAGPGFASYRWQDGAIGQTYTTFETGAFWVEATTACGDVVSDTINILLDTVIAIALRPDTSICPGNSVTLSTPQDPAYTYQWAPAATLDCSDCPTVTASPDSTTTYNLVVSNNTGCVSVDSVTITVEGCGSVLDTALCLGDSVLIEGRVFYPNETDTLQLPDGSSLIATVSALDTFYQALNLEACAGEPLEYNGAMLQPGQTELFTFTAANGCDSTIEVTALQLDPFFTTIDTAICQGESIDYNGTLLQPGQSETFRFTATNGCDSTVLVSVSRLDAYFQALELGACAGEAIEYNGTILEPGQSQWFTFTTAGGCDSIVEVTALQLDTFSTTLDTAICRGESLDYNGSLLQPGQSEAFTFTASTGCDSTVRVNVTALDTVLTALEVHTCFGAPYIFEGVELPGGSTTPFTFNGANGCDSTVLLTVVELEDNQTYEAIAVCQGETGYVFGEPVTKAGLYTETYESYLGCDSTHNIAFVVQDTAVLNIEPGGLGCGSRSGSLTVEISGATPPYAILWSNGQTTATIDGLAVGAYSVTVTDAFRCSSVGVQQVYDIIPRPTAEPGSTPVSCFGEKDGAIQLNNPSGGTPPYEYSLDGEQWQQEGLFSGLAPGNYILFIRDAEGCEATYPANVSEPAPVGVRLPGDTTLRLGDSIRLAVTVISGMPSIYEWMPPTGLDCKDCPAPIARPAESTLYRLTARDSSGCTGTDEVFIDVDRTVRSYLPNAFSPNQDGRNDFFTVFAGPEVEQVQTLQVFSRWGEQVFKRDGFPPNQENLGWDGNFRGQPMPAGVYAFYGELLLRDGKVEVVKGEVALAR